MKIRTNVTKNDPQNVRDIVESTGFFHSYEIDVAVELVEENLRLGEKESGYYFVFMDDDTGKTIGYSCYGEIACTKDRYDLYWMAVYDNLRGKGIGRQLLTETEKKIAERGGQIVYIETSSKPKYIPTRKFYDKTNYTLIAELKDFYADGDNKVIYSKRVS